jgi:magnesium transporter
VPSREPRLEEVKHGDLTWINIDQPTAVDLEALARRFDFHELDYEDVLSRRQRPKVDEYTDYIFVVLHFPRYDKTVGRLNTAELDIFLGENFIITCPNSPLRPLSRVFHRCQADEAYRTELFDKGPGYALYRVLSELFDYCFPILDKIGHKLDEIEDGIFEGRAREMVRLISNVKQEIIAFRKIIKPEIATLRFLEAKTATRFIPDSLEIYFDDVIDAGERIRDILENNKEVIEALEDTNENVVQHRLNDILLALTIISATVLPVTLLTSIYGMNIDLPLQGSDHAFLAVTAMMLAIFASFLGYFKYRKWF